MTDDTNVTPATKPEKATTAKRVPTSSLHVRFAKVKGIDVTRAAKLNRSYMRSNFEALTRVWPELRKSQKANRDGNRWPDTVPAKVGNMIVTRTIPASRAK